MRATMVRLVSWSVFVLGVPLFAVAEERMETLERSCDASVWSVPEDEVKLCVLFYYKYHAERGHGTTRLDPCEHF